MGKKKYKKILVMLIWAVLAVLAFPVTANADTGPKPSVRISFENMGDELCYGTLLSEEASTGPASAWNGTEEDARTNEEKPDSGYFAREIWEAFVGYEDPEGYYFLQVGWTVSETGEISWTYYPPSRFKILLYYPETETFVTSGIYERYAFDSYFTVDMEGVDISTADTEDQLEANRSYAYGQEVLSLAVRIVITIMIEMVIALLFGFRKKQQLLILALVNIITQIVLNVLLNIVNYNSGPMAFTMMYVVFEIVVFIAESVVYCRLLKQVSKVRKENWYYVAYSFVANAVSFGAGLFLAGIFPDIF